MKALYIVGDKIFNPSKTVCVQRDICVFYMNKLEFTKVFQDNMLSAFRFLYKLEPEGKESKSRQRLTMKIAIDTMRMYIFLIYETLFSRREVIFGVRLKSCRNNNMTF